MIRNFLKDGAAALSLAAFLAIVICYLPDVSDYLINLTR
jgi:hypothetical protein